MEILCFISKMRVNWVLNFYTQKNTDNMWSKNTKDKSVICLILKVQGLIKIIEVYAATSTSEEEIEMLFEIQTTNLVLP